MEITLGQQYNAREKPTVILYTYYIDRHAGTPERLVKTKQKQCSTPSNMVVVIVYYCVGCKYKATTWYVKKNQNAPRPSEHPLVRGKKRLGGIKGCKYKTSSWHLNGFRDGNNIGSTV